MLQHRRPRERWPVRRRRGVGLLAFFMSTVGVRGSSPEVSPQPGQTFPLPFDVPYTTAYVCSNESGTPVALPDAFSTYQGRSIWFQRRAILIVAIFLAIFVVLIIGTAVFMHATRDVEECPTTEKPDTRTKPLRKKSVILSLRRRIRRRRPPSRRSGVVGGDDEWEDVPTAPTTMLHIPAAPDAGNEDTPRPAEVAPPISEVPTVMVLPPSQNDEPNVLPPQSPHAQVPSDLSEPGSRMMPRSPSLSPVSPTEAPVSPLSRVPTSRSDAAPDQSDIDMVDAMEPSFDGMTLPPSYVTANASGHQHRSSTGKAPLAPLVPPGDAAAAPPPGPQPPPPLPLAWSALSDRTDDVPAPSIDWSAHVATTEKSTLQALHEAPSAPPEVRVMPIPSAPEIAVPGTSSAFPWDSAPTAPAWSVTPAPSAPPFMAFAHLTDTSPHMIPPAVSPLGEEAQQTASEHEQLAMLLPSQPSTNLADGLPSTYPAPSAPSAPAEIIDLELGLYDVESSAPRTQKG